jgi:hypothetical protein
MQTASSRSTASDTGCGLPKTCWARVINYEEADGQCHVHRYMRPLLNRIENGDLDPSFIVSHRMALEEAARGYELVRDKQNRCVKVVFDSLSGQPVGRRAGMGDDSAHRGRPQRGKHARWARSRT